MAGFFESPGTPQIDFQLPPMGFGSYLQGIIPDDQAVLAGAFATAMLQVKNIEELDITTFAQVAYNNETIIGIPLVNGTNIPTDLELAVVAQQKTALGSGVYGTYTHSNFFGCMSGLPYPLADIYNGITQLETEKLYNIYDEMYLAVTWEAAVVATTTEERAVNKRSGITVNATLIQDGCTYIIASVGDTDFTAIGASSNSVGVEFVATGSGTGTGTATEVLWDWQYKITEVELINPGGGYGRGSAPAPGGNWGGVDYYGGEPTIIIKMDVDPGNAPGDYGRVELEVTGTTPWVTYRTDQCTETPDKPDIWFYIDKPPIEELPVQADGNVSEDGVNIPTYGSETDPNNPSYPAWSAWPSPMNNVVDDYIAQANEEIQAIKVASPDNFEAATILNVNWDIMGTALKHEQRARYIAISPVPVPYDKWLNTKPTVHYVFVDSIPQYALDTLPHMAVQTLEHISDLKLRGGQSIVGLMREERNKARLGALGINLDNNIPDTLSDPEIQILITNGTLPNAIEGVPSPIRPYTIPAYPVNTKPVSVTDPNLQRQREIITTRPGSIGTILVVTNPGPNDNGTGPIVPGEPLIPIVCVGPRVPEKTGGVIPIGPPGGPNNAPTDVGNGPPSDQPTDGIIPETGQPPTTTLVGYPPFLPLGRNQVPKIIPDKLNTAIIGTTVIPPTYTVPEAIDSVIECNCTCWVQ